MTTSPPCTLLYHNPLSSSLNKVSTFWIISSIRELKVDNESTIFLLMLEESESLLREAAMSVCPNTIPIKFQSTSKSKYLNWRHPFCCLRPPLKLYSKALNEVSKNYFKKIYLHEIVKYTSILDRKLGDGFFEPIYFCFIVPLFH